MNLPSPNCEICGKRKNRYIDHTACHKKRLAKQAIQGITVPDSGAISNANMEAKLARHTSEYITTGIASAWLKAQPLQLLAFLARQRADYVDRANGAKESDQANKSGEHAN
jgi:hypothetical protein